MEELGSVAAEREQEAPAATLIKIMILITAVK